MRLLSVASDNTDNRQIRLKEKADFVSSGDLHYMLFLEKFKYATGRNIALAVDRKYNTAMGHLSKLKRMGIVKNIAVYGTPGVWALTNIGCMILDTDRKAPSLSGANATALAERIYVNHVAACLWSNKVNCLNLDDFPYNGRLFQGEYIRGEELIPEQDLLSSLIKKRTELIGGIFVKEKVKGEGTRALSDYWEITWRKWENNGKKDISPEEIKGNEMLYILFSRNEFSSSFIIPDIVVKRPRLSDGTPGNIAVEVEKSIKAIDYYIKKLTIYKEDTRVYSKVIYVTPNKKIAEKILEAAEKINFDRFDIVPMMDEEGKVTTQKQQWLL